MPLCYGRYSVLDEGEQHRQHPEGAWVDPVDKGDEGGGDDQGPVADVDGTDEGHVDAGASGLLGDAPFREGLDGIFDLVADGGVEAHPVEVAEEDRRHGQGFDAVCCGCGFEQGQVGLVVPDLVADDVEQGLTVLQSVEEVEGLRAVGAAVTVEDDQLDAVVRWGGLGLGIGPPILLRRILVLGTVERGIRAAIGRQFGGQFEESDAQLGFQQIGIQDVGRHIAPGIGQGQSGVL